MREGGERGRKEEEGGGGRRRERKVREGEKREGREGDERRKKRRRREEEEEKEGGRREEEERREEEREGGRVERKQVSTLACLYRLQLKLLVLLLCEMLGEGRETEGRETKAVYECWAGKVFYCGVMKVWVGHCQAWEDESEALKWMRRRKRRRKKRSLCWKVSHCADWSYVVVLSCWVLGPGEVGWWVWGHEELSLRGDPDTKWTSLGLDGVRVRGSGYGFSTLLQG